MEKRLDRYSRIEPILEPELEALSHELLSEIEQRSVLVMKTDEVSAARHLIMSYFWRVASETVGASSRIFLEDIMNDIDNLDEFKPDEDEDYDY